MSSNRPAIPLQKISLTRSLSLEHAGDCKMERQPSTSEIEISGISDEELLSALSEGIQKVDEQDIGEE